MPRNKSEQRRRILQAAIRVFARQGWKGATTRALGAVAGVNSALIYYYFENKQCLFTEAIQTVLGDFLAELQRHQSAFRGAENRLRFLVKGVFRYYTANPERLRLMAQAILMHPDLFQRALASFLPKSTPAPLVIIQEGIRRGELRRSHPLQTWWHIIGLCLFNLQIHEMIHGLNHPTLPIPKPTLAGMQDSIVALLKQGLAVSDASSGRNVAHGHN